MEAEEEDETLSHNHRKAPTTPPPHCPARPCSGS